MRTDRTPGPGGLPAPTDRRRCPRRPGGALPVTAAAEGLTIHASARRPWAAHASAALHGDVTESRAALATGAVHETQFLTASGGPCGPYFPRIGAVWMGGPGEMLP